jgi:hypothetical protein
LYDLFRYDVLGATCYSLFTGPAQANDIAKEGIRLVLKYKDAVMHDCLAALVDARAAHYTVSPDPYAGMVL